MVVCTKNSKAKMSRLITRCDQSPFKEFSLCDEVPATNALHCNDAMKANSKSLLAKCSKEMFKKKCLLQHLQCPSMGRPAVEDNMVDTPYCPNLHLDKILCPALNI